MTQWFELRRILASRVVHVLMKLREEMLQKLAKMATVPQPILATKRRGCALQQPPSKRLFTEEEQTSPAVVVSEI